MNKISDDRMESLEEVFDPTWDESLLLFEELVSVKKTIDRVKDFFNEEAGVKKHEIYKELLKELNIPDTTKEI